MGSKDWAAAGETTYVTQFGYDHRPGDRGDVRDGFDRVGHATLFLAGVIVIIVPMLFALLIGKYLFKMDPGILLGACAGARIDKSKPLYKRFRRDFRTNCIRSGNVVARPSYLYPQFDYKLLWFRFR